MVAHVCDACGQMYEFYRGVDGKYFDGNAITAVTIEKDGRIFPKTRLELCPVCMKDFWDYVTMEFVRKESPMYEKINNPVKTVKETPKAMTEVTND